MLRAQLGAELTRGRSWSSGPRKQGESCVRRLGDTSITAAGPQSVAVLAYRRMSFPCPQMTHRQEFVLIEFSPLLLGKRSQLLKQHQIS